MAIFSNIQHIINGVDIDTLLGKIDTLTSELESIKTESSKSISTLSSKLEQAQKKNEIQKKDLIRETNRRQIVESRLTESETRLISLEKEKNELTKTEKKLKDDLQRLGSSNSSLNGKNLTLHNKVTKLEEQIQILKDKINAKDAEVLSITTNAQKLEKSIEKESQLLDEANNLVETLNEDNKQLKAKITALSDQNSEKSNEVERLKKINIELTADCEDRLQRIDVLEKNIEDVKKSFEAVTSDNNSLKQTCESLSSENNVLINKYNDLFKRYNTINSEYQSLKSENNEARNEIESQKVSLEQANAENIMLNNELQTLQTQIEQLNSEKEELKPYIYLIEAKKEEEAKECVLNQAKDTFKEIIDNASDLLSELKHDEVATILSSAISTAQEQMCSAKDIVAIDEAKHELDNFINQAKLKEQELIEEEQRKLKEEEEAKVLEFIQTKETLHELIDKANNVLSELKHDEVSTILSSAISTAQERMESAKDIAAIHEAKHELDNSINQAKLKEQELIEEEQREHQEKVASENAAILLSETRNALTRLIDEVKKYKETIEYADIATELQYVIESVERFSEVKTDNIEEIQSNILSLKTALSNAKNEVNSEKKTQSHVVKRSILEIFDTKEGNIIESEKFFKRPEHELVRWRRIFEESILYAEHRFICTNCRQDVKISGRKYERGQVAFFSHLHDSDFCEIKTTTGLSKEQIEARKYGLIAESERHKKLKKLIHQALEGYSSRQKGVNNVVEEKRVNSDIDIPYLNWRRPDVMADYNDIHLVFELQLSTTFVSVVVQRDIFYRLNDYFIIWVFNFDDNEKYVDLANLMCKDIYYANKRNVFIFDKDAQQESEERGELVLKCNWLDIDNTWHYSSTKGNGDGVLITLDQLKLDKETCKPYFFDAETPYYEIHPSVKERILKEERSKQQILDDLQAGAKGEAEEAIIKRDAALKDMVKNDGTVAPFKVGNRYGFKFNNIVLVPAKYSSYSSFGDKGMFKVSFNRHYGLIDRYGNEIFPCDYLDFQRLSNGVIIAESTSGFYMSGIGNISSRRPHDIISLKYVSSEISILQHNSSDLNIYIIDDELVLKKDYYGFSFYLLSGEKKTDIIYSEIRFTKNNSAIWLKNAETKLWQIAELDGAQRNEKLYTECTFKNNATIAKLEGKCDVYNPNGDFLISTDYDTIEEFSNFAIYKVHKNNLIGLVNLQFEEILPVIYSEINQCGIFIIANKDEQWGVFNTEGVRMSDNIFSTIKIFKPYDSKWGNWLLVTNNDKCGLYNDQGKLIVAPNYDHIDTVDDIIIISSEGKQGVVNKEGLTLLENQYDSIVSLRNKYNLRCQKDNKFYLFNSETELLSDNYYDSIEKFTDCHLTAKVGDNFGLLDVDGKTCIPFEYEQIDLMCDLDDDNFVFKCKKNGSVCAFDISKQEEIIPAKYDDIKYLVGNYLYGIKTKECWGLYNIEKGQISEFKYSQLSYYNEGRIAATVKENDVMLKGFLDVNGHEVFSSETQSEDGLCIKKFFGKWGVYDEKGNVLLPLEVMDAMTFTKQNGYFKVCKEMKYGIKHISGKYVVNPEYRDIISKEDQPFWILQLIRYKKERRAKSVPYSSYSYSWGRRRYYTSYRTKYCDETVEYNPYKLVKLDGSQDDFSKDICGEFNSMSFVLKGFVIADNRLISLSRLSISSEIYTNYTQFKEDEDFILTESEGKYGLLSYSLNVIVPCKYSHISIWGKNLLLATAVEKNIYHDRTYYDLYNKDGVLCPIGSLASIDEIEDGKAKVLKDGQCGFIDELGNIIPENVSRVDKHIITQTVFGSLEILDNHGEKLFDYNDNISCIEVLTDGCYKLKKNNNWALYILPTSFTSFSYESIELWTESIAILSKSINISGKDYDDEGKYIKVYELKSLGGYVVSSKEYTKISPLSDGIAMASRDGYTGQIDSNGVEIYDTIEALDENFIKRRKFGLWDVTDYNNNVILSLDFSDITLLNNQYLLATQKKGNNIFVKSLFDLSGKKVLEYDFKDMTDCRNGYYIISNDSGCALLDQSMSETISFSCGYKYLRKWSDSKYVASKSSYSYNGNNQKLVLLDNKGNILTKSEYSKIGDLENERAEVILNGKTGYINESCEIIVDEIDKRGDWKITKSFSTFCLYKGNNAILQDLTDASFFNNTIVKIKRDNNYIKLFSLDYEKELSNDYSSVGELDGEYAYAVKVNGAKGKLDTNGNEYEEVVEEKDNWKIMKSFERFFITYDATTILGDLWCASFVGSNLVKYKESRDSLFKLFSISTQESLLGTYRSIEYTEDDKIVAVNENNISGSLDSDGNGIPEIIRFNGGYLTRSFGDYSIVNDSEEIIIPIGYSKIELLEDDTLFVLWKNNKAIIANLSNEKTESEYDSVKSIGNGFYVVSRTIPKRISVRKTGYGYYGNPYTYYASKDIPEKKFGIIDSKLKTVIPCKYKSLSGPDDEQNLTAINAKGEEITISLNKIQKKSTKAFELIEGSEYIAKVKAFMAIGVIVIIQNDTYIIHKRYLYKEKKDFSKGELLYVTYLGIDKYEHPTWSTRESTQTDG